MDNQPSRPAGRRAATGRPSILPKLLFGLAIAALFLYIFLHGTQFRELARALKSVSPPLFAAAVVIALSGFWLRALRWSCYLRPVKEVPTRVSFEIMMIGYMVSNFLPGRVGDFVARPALMSRDQRIPVATSLATIAVERLFDAITVLLFFAAYIAFFAPAELAGLDLGYVRLVGWAMLGLCLLVTAFLVGLRVQKNRFLALIAWLASPLPAGLQARLMVQMHSFAGGLNLFDDLRNAFRSIVYSVLAWVTVAVSMWLVCASLGLDPVRPVDTLLLVGLGALGVAIPSPGGVGSMHYLLLKGLQGLEAGSEETLQAAAILIWAMTWVPINLYGIIALRQRGVRLAELEEDAAAEPPDGATGPTAAARGPA